jgi:hypothetical protein
MHCWSVLLVGFVVVGMTIQPLVNELMDEPLMMLHEHPMMMHEPPNAPPMILHEHLMMMH